MDIKVIILSFLLFGFSYIGESADGNIDPGTEATIVVDFHIVAGLMVLEAEVDGKSGKYLLDSGSPSLILNKAGEKGDVLFTSVDGDLRAKSSQVKVLRIGSLQKENVAAWSMDLSKVERKLGAKIDGLIGADLLEQYDFLIDFKLQQVSFISRGNNIEGTSSNVIALPYVDHHDNLPVVSMLYKGKELRMCFDTGAGISVIAEKAVRGNTRGKLSSVNLGRLQLEQFPFQKANLNNLKDSQGRGLDGILSVHALNADRVLISSSRKTIYLFWNKEIQG